MCIICVCNIAEYIKYVKQGVNKRGGKAYSPQTDSVPSVDRAISCFNKHVYLIIFYFSYTYFLLKVGVCRIFFGSLPKPNIRQFGRIFCRSRIEGLFLPNSTIRQENLNYRL